MRREHVTDKRLRLAQKVVDEPVQVAELFEPNAADYGTSVLQPLSWWVERRAIHAGGVAPSTLWVLTRDKLYIFVARLTLWGWRVRRLAGSWNRSEISARPVEGRGNIGPTLALELLTPDGRVEARAMVNSDNAHLLVKELAVASRAHEDYGRMIRPFPPQIVRSSGLAWQIAYFLGLCAFAGWLILEAAPSPNTWVLIVFTLLVPVALMVFNRLASTKNRLGWRVGGAYWVVLMFGTALLGLWRTLGYW